VACLNFWCGLALAPSALTHVLRDAFPDILSLEPPTPRPELLAPEWMGARNYLGEQDSPGHRRRRGQYATSADLFLVYRDTRGARHGILLESKYTESYRDARSCADLRRLGIYRPHIEATTSPIHLPVGLELEELFVEPFYQLLRQQLLAAAMEADKALGLLTVSVLHVSPAANRSFHEELPPNLAYLGNDVTDVWGSMLKDRSKFRTISYEAAWTRARESDAAELQGWYEYQEERCQWPHLQA
jgi:hypothetical protein